MNKALAVTLILLGLFELFWGYYGGPVMIYGYEAPFQKSLGAPNLSTEQYEGFNRHIRIYKNQWHIVIWFGLITLITGAHFTYRAHCKEKQNI